MPSSIPYDPSLVLGNVVSPEKLENVVRIAELQAPADAAQADLNSLITLKRSVDMTLQEMLDMNINVSEILSESKEIAEQIRQAAVNYAKAKLEAEKAIQPLRAQIAAVNSEIESPIDYNRSQLKSMGLSTDSLQLNVQYFSCDQNEQRSHTHASDVASFVSESLSFFGSHYAHQASSSVQTQINSQTSNHSIAGTLVISITCTHRDALVFAPFILDVDKAVRAWNQIYPGNPIKTNSPLSILLTELTAETAADKAMYILSGATYGSSFVGMVHILNTTRTVSHQQMESVAAAMQENFKVGGWFAHGTGGFGVEGSFSNSAKNLLSTQNIQSHCSLTTMGIIPSIKSNQVKLGVSQLMDLDPAKEMEKLATLQGATAAENNTLASAAEAARTGQQMISLQNATISAALTGLSEIDDGQNNMIDINSMMTAMDDYIGKCVAADENVGVPINYYLKPLTKSMITRAWLAKYYPNSFNAAGKADDSEPQQSGE